MPDPIASGGGGESAMFPVLGCEERLYRQIGCPKRIPWGMVAPHEEAAQQNHGQSIKRLAERGGLCPEELFAVLQGLRWRDAEMQLGLRVDRELGAAKAVQFVITAAAEYAESQKKTLLERDHVAYFKLKQRNVDKQRRRLLAERLGYKALTHEADSCALAFSDPAEAKRHEARASKLRTIAARLRGMK